MASTPTQSDGISPGMKLAAGWAWRFLVVFAAIAVVVWLIVQISVIVIPVLIAILLAALLSPISHWLQRHKWPRWLAIVVSFVGLLAIIGSLVTLVIQQVRHAAPDLAQRSEAFIDSTKDFLGTNFNIHDLSLNSIINEVNSVVAGNSSFVTSGIASIGATAGHALTGFAIVVFATIYFLIDGKNIWRWIVSLFPKNAHKAIDGAGRSGWSTLVNFVKSQIVVAGIDAVGIGLGALFLGLPLVLPIAVAVFLGSFIPVVGAIVTGAMAIFIALVFEGPVQALIMLAVVLAVQQIESHILQPFLIGKSVEVHPLAVILAVTIGSLIAGIPGALFAVPLVATVNGMATYIAQRKWQKNAILDGTE